MGLNANTKAFSSDVLRVEVTGPSQPHLTLVDLPGLIHAENKQQSASDVSLVASLVQLYMAQSRSIILAVVSVKNDLANQIVTKLARDVDPKGARTSRCVENDGMYMTTDEGTLNPQEPACPYRAQRRLSAHEPSHLQTMCLVLLCLVLYHTCLLQQADGTSWTPHIASHLALLLMLAVLPISSSNRFLSSSSSYETPLPRSTAE